MSTEYEKTFSVHVPAERAFRAFTDPTELEQWFTPKFEADAEEGAPGVQAQAESPGGDVHFEVTQIKDDELLCYRQWAADPETGIDVTVVFEPVEGGTKITVTHAGFGGDSILKSDSVRNGMFENYADLILYLDHGISYPRDRDITTEAWPGALFLDAGAGAEVSDVDAGGFANEIGLQPGDILLQLGAGAVFGNRQVCSSCASTASGRGRGVVGSRRLSAPRHGTAHAARPRGIRPQRLSYSGRSTSTAPSRTRTA